MHRLNQADSLQMKKNLDDNFTFELGLNLGIFKIKMPSISFDKTNIDIFLRFFRKKIIKYVFICRNFKIPFVQTTSLTLGLKTVCRGC